MNRTIFALILVASATAAPADQSVYSTKLDNGWEDWSWAKVTKSGKTVTVNATKWQALYFHHREQASSGFRSVSFNANGGATGGQKLVVHVIVNKKALGGYNLALAPGKTQHVSIPLQKLGLTGQKFEGIWIQSRDASTFRVTDFTFKSK